MMFERECLPVCLVSVSLAFVFRSNDSIVTERLIVFRLALTMMDFDLKEVFAILDENGEGQIQLRRFVDVANNYYSDAEVSASLLSF